MERQTIHRFTLGPYTVEVAEINSAHAVSYEATLLTTFRDTHLREVLVTAGPDELHEVIRLLRAAAMVMDGLLNHSTPPVDGDLPGQPDPRGLADLQHRTW